MKRESALTLNQNPVFKIGSNKPEKLMHHTKGRSFLVWAVLAVYPVFFSGCYIIPTLGYPYYEPIAGHGSRSMKGPAWSVDEGDIAFGTEMDTISFAFDQVQLDVTLGYKWYRPYNILVTLSIPRGASVKFIDDEVEWFIIKEAGWFTRKEEAHVRSRLRLSAFDCETKLDEEFSPARYLQYGGSFGDCVSRDQYVFQNDAHDGILLDVEDGDDAFFVQFPAIEINGVLHEVPLIKFRRTRIFVCTPCLLSF